MKRRLLLIAAALLILAAVFLVATGVLPIPRLYKTCLSRRIEYRSYPLVGLTWVVVCDEWAAETSRIGVP